MTESMIQLNSQQLTALGLKPMHQVHYQLSPEALTEISIAVDKMLEHNFKFLIFDSLTNLIIYTEREPIAKFIASLVNKIKTSNTRAIFYAVRIKEQEELINEAGMFVDKVIELGKDWEHDD